MAENSKIGWTDHTFNPWRGCVKVSPGCSNCYAERGSKRNPKVLGIWGTGGTRVLANFDQWREPPKWNRESGGFHPIFRVFCASLADVFEDWDGQMSNSREQKLWTPRGGEDVHFAEPVEIRGTREPYTLDHARKRLWGLIRETPNLDWLLLTKRPENVARMMPHGEWKNVWLGTTVESEEYKVRADQLLDAAQYVKVPVRFVSAEPMIGATDFGGALSREGINWLIVGGESGAYDKIRPFRMDQARFMALQARQAGVPCFMKQLGSRPLGYDGQEWPHTHEGDPKNEVWDVWPAGIKVRQFPEVPFARTLEG